MATYDRNLGVWRANDGTSGFASQGEAEEYERTGVRSSGNDTSGFGQVYDALAPSNVRPSDAAVAESRARGEEAARQRLADQQYENRRDHFSGSVSNNYGLSLDPSTAAEAGRDQKQAVDSANERDGGFWGDVGRLSLYTAGAIANPIGFVAGSHLGKPAQAALNPVGFGTQQVLEQAAGKLPGGSGTGVGVGSTSSGYAPSGAGGSPGIRTPPRPESASQGLAGGAQGYAGNIEDDRAQRDDDRTKLSDLYEKSRFDAGEDARQSRDQQQQALAKQSELYNALASFDPDTYAQRASDLALKNQLALARSGDGGAAAGADRMFSAIESAPAIGAQTRREANQEQLDRQRLAAQVTGQMGDLASQTRGQDVNESQLESDFGLRIADGISQVTGLDWELDSNESRSLAQISLALDAQDIDWARLDLDAQRAEVDRVLAEAGLAQQWRMFKQSSQLSEKDLYGGLLTLLGTGLGGYFQIAAAKAGGVGSR